MTELISNLTGTVAKYGRYNVLCMRTNLTTEYIRVCSNTKQATRTTYDTLVSVKLISC